MQFRVKYWATLLFVLTGCGGIGSSGLDETTVRKAILDSQPMYSANLDSLEVVTSDADGTEAVGIASDGTKYSFTVSKSRSGKLSVSWEGDGRRGYFTIKTIEVRK